MTNATSEPKTEIDFDHLNLYVQGDVNLTQEVFGLFKHQVDMWSRLLQADTDDETWASVTHSLKGSARAVGAQALADRCERAEGLIGDKASSGGRLVAVQDIEFRVSRAIADIQRWEYQQTLKNMRNPD